MKRGNISKVFLTEKKNEEDAFNKKKILEQKPDDEINKQKIIKEIERKTETKVLGAIVSGQITNPLTEKNNVKQLHNQDALQTILSNSATEFKERTGRDLTYGEMRQMFG